MVKVSIIGAGYAGLVTGVGLAYRGFDVICVERTKEKVDLIRQGKSTIHEKNLDDFLAKLVNNKFQITSDIEHAVKNTNVTMVCVGTYSREDGRIDLSQIEDAMAAVGNILKSKDSYHTIVVKSTVVPTTTRKFIIPVLERTSGKKAGEDFGIAVNPEFLREGHALEDFIKPDRIVVGTFDEKSGEALDELYNPFNSKMIITTLETAEMIKYVNNTFLGLMISFSNEIADICESVGVDMNPVLEGLYHDGRLSPKIGNAKVFPGILSYISPGPGFGGSCLPKDILALAKFAEDIGLDPKMVKSIIDINNERPKKMVIALENAIGNLSGKTITVLGTAFKPDTDDIRSSPSIEIIRMLLEKGANVKIYDPVAMENTRVLLKDEVIYSDSLQNSLKGSDACLLVTKWGEFKSLTPDMMKAWMKTPVVVDCRRMLDSSIFDGKDVKYIGVGLG